MNYRRRRDLLASLFWWAALLFTIGFWYAAFVLFLLPAFAHDATPTAANPLGWRYPVSCCSQNDCGMISYKTVKETPDGYVITLTPKDHLMIVKDTTFVIPYSDSKIKESPDGEYHICVTRQHESPDKTAVFGGAVLCFFVPPKGS